jgi:transposase
MRGAMATLLRGDLVARAHVPRKETPARKNLLRQRLYWARLRTMLRNRIHALLDRQRDLELPQCSDIFGVRGLGFLRRLELSEPDGTLLGEARTLHDLIAQQMKAQEKRIAAEFRLEPMHARLLSVPGVGPTLAAVLAAEIDQIERFPNADKLCGYAGVVRPRPTVRAAKSITGGGCLRATSGCAGRWWRRAGWRLAARPTSALFTGNNARAARKPTLPSPSSRGGCAESSSNC